MVRYDNKHQYLLLMNKKPMETIKYRDELGLLRLLLSVPFIYPMIIPFIFLHICLEIYHQVCFPLYGIPKVNLKDHMRMDRQKLEYLNVLEKMNCYYCGYANGLIKYTKAILSETEKMWCPIKSQPAPGYEQPEHRKDFAEYGDKEGLQEYMDQRKNK